VDIIDFVEGYTLLDNYLNQIDEQIKFLHAVKQVHNIHFHLHRGCEIYFLLRGDVNYFVEKTVYPLQYGDLIITNEQEIHKPAFSTKALYERVTIEFNPMLASLFQTGSFQPLACFYNRPNGKKNKIKLTNREVSLLKSLFTKYDYLLKHPSEGDSIIKMGCFMEILVLINRFFSDNRATDSGVDLPLRLTPILEYIDLHPEEDLSLERLEKMFYMNRYYLSRLFKQYTGSTIHAYIVYKRISMAKRLLAEGCNVTEACVRSGFNDYTSFLRMFKKKVGVLPKDYTKLPFLGGP
jgi:AraC-like DNA-binding protein